jgi:hypothetical protein
MANGTITTLETKLQQAEQAEADLVRLESLAAEAPQLREEIAKVELAKDRREKRETSIQEAKKSSQAAAEMQKLVPEFLGTASIAVKELYTVLRDIDIHRREACQALAIADRVDYDIEVEQGEEHEISLDRDPRGLAYAFAARHGDPRVRQMLEELDPGFNFLRDCYVGEQLHRDLADFVIQHAVRQPHAAEAQVMPAASDPGENQEMPAGVTAEG